MKGTRTSVRKPLRHALTIEKGSDKWFLRRLALLGGLYWTLLADRFPNYIWLDSPSERLIDRHTRELRDRNILGKGRRPTLAKREGKAFAQIRNAHSENCVLYQR